MKITHFLQTTQIYEIQAVSKPSNYEQLKQTHVPFYGSPRNHPYDDDKIILIADPYSCNTIYYEFKNCDIAFIEEKPHIVNLDGDDIATVIVWVLKNTIAIRSAPFLVGDTGI